MYVTHDNNIMASRIDLNHPPEVFVPYSKERMQADPDRMEKLMLLQSKINANFLLKELYMQIQAAVVMRTLCKKNLEFSGYWTPEITFYVFGDNHDSNYFMPSSQFIEEIAQAVGLKTVKRGKAASRDMSFELYDVPLDSEELAETSWYIFEKVGDKDPDKVRSLLKRAEKAMAVANKIHFESIPWFPFLQEKQR